MMIRSDQEKTLRAFRTLRDAPLFHDKSGIDITLFANYYGTVEKSHKFNDPALYTDKPWYSRFMNEIRAMRIFRRNKKHASKNN